MPNYSDFVRDDYERPIPGALAELFAIDGTTLIDTDTAGADGQFTVTGPDAKCILQVSFGGVSERSTVIVGNPPEYVGPPGQGLPDLMGPGGSALVGFKAAPSPLARTAQSKMSDVLSVLDFIPQAMHAAISNGTSTDDVTSYIQAAINYLNQVGVSGALYFPHGIYRVSSINVTYTTNAPLRLYGDGIRSSVLRKIGVTTTPVLSLISSQALLDVYPEISNMSFDGLNIASTGIKIVDCARVYMHRVSADFATVGIDGAGFLSSKMVNCRTDDCEIGIRTRQAAVVHSNLLVISQHEARSCTKWGMDFGGGEAIRVTDSEIQNNGAAGDQTTGGVVIRSTVGSEAGLGSITFENNYFEVCKGNGLLIEDNPALNFTMIAGGFYANEGGRAVTIGNIRSSTIIDAKAGSATDVVRVAAQNSLIIGGIAFAIADTSVHRVQINASTSAAHYALSANEIYGFGSTGNEMLVASDDIVGGGNAGTTTFYKRGGRLQFSFPVGSIPLALEAGKVGWYQTIPVGKQTISGALSAVTDPNAKAVLTSIISALSTPGQVTNGTS